jgi:ATP synthase protein I
MAEFHVKAARRSGVGNHRDERHEADGRDSDWGVPAEPPAPPLTREQAQALTARHPRISPWRVITVQVLVALSLAVVAWLWSGRREVVASLLYGGATVVVPGMLMARGLTSRLATATPGSGAMAFMLWEMVKIGVSVAMLVLANRIVQPLSWPALLVGLVVCLKVYWVALAWRR